MVSQRLGPVAGPLAEQLRERRARRGPLGLELERAAVGLDRAVDVFERARAQAAELVEHVRQARRIVSGMLRGEVGERARRRRAIVPARAAGAPRRPPPAMQRGSACRGDAERLGRPLRLAAPLEQRARAAARGSRAPARRGALASARVASASASSARSVSQSSVASRRHARARPGSAASAARRCCSAAA